MTDINDLKSIIMLTYLKDYMLEKIAKITNIKEYRAGDYIFNEGDEAKNLYAVINGKVGLEIEKNSSTRIFFKHINQGMTFGFCALVDIEDKSYMDSAKALSDTKLFIWKAEDLEALFRVGLMLAVSTDFPQWNENSEFRPAREASLRDQP